MAPSRIAIVPARGGSKRIPNKNIRNFCGRPMISHILDTAQASNLFDVVHVSTEDARIAQVAAELGFPVSFMRPAELADDHTTLMPVLQHVVEMFAARSQRFDEVWLLMACAPLIDTDDLHNGASLFAQAGGQMSVMAVAAYPAPIEWAFERQQDGRLNPVQPGMFAVRSQDLTAKYFNTGTFCVYPERRVRESTGPGDDRGYVGLIMPRHKAVDIDNEEDWHFAELIFRSIEKSPQLKLP
jgi:N-acylneuraminate cytidylyltransferase